jgi:hypothetical protein
MKKLMLLLLGLLLMGVGSVQAADWPISYVLTGALSGEYAYGAESGRLQFVDAPFTFSVTADTSKVVAVDWFGSKDIYGVGNYPYVFSGPNLGGSLVISNVGTFAFANPLWVLDAQADSPYLGDFGIGTDVEDVFLKVNDAFFETYHLITAVSPLEVALWQFGEASFAVSSGETTGTLFLTGASSSLTFQAEGGVVPEPSTFALLGAGLAGVMVMRRKSRMK